ncbi:MAG: hypothetical protein IPK96_10735 [Flammeovirgaceae bacterium]|jgi:hypothetical protein|nr:hypothetical protein [Flammeovirgaceae bacterium]
MRKIYTSLMSLVLLGAFGLAFTSCKDDEPEKFNLTFASATGSAKESDLEIQIEIKLDKPAPEDITVKFKLSGTALDDVRADTENDYADYEVDGDYDKVVIAQGEISANITLIPYSDDVIEDDETIIVTVTEVDNVNVLFEASLLTTFTLEQEDGVIIVLEWLESNTTNGFVDMDLIVRIGPNPTTVSTDYNGIVTGSAFHSFGDNFEFTFIPKTFIGTFFDLNYTNTAYGLTYNYYDGTRDNLTFTSTFIDLVNGVAEPEISRLEFTGNYTLANLYKWGDLNENGTIDGSELPIPTAIVQTFRNVGGVYQDFTQITTPLSGSRTAINTTGEFVNSLYRGNTIKSLKRHTLPEKYRRQF